MYYILGIRNVDRHFKRNILLYQLQRHEMLNEINPLSSMRNCKKVTGKNSGRAYFKLLVRTVSKTIRMVDFTSHIPTVYPVNKPA